MEKSKDVLALFAHPDDVEFLCAGTLVLLHQQGWNIHIATMTPGDVGSSTLSREEISRIRRAEAAKSASLLDGSYDCLECDDVKGRSRDDWSYNWFFVQAFFFQRLF